jgi:hypothetical protein
VSTVLLALLLASQGVGIINVGQSTCIGTTATPARTTVDDGNFRFTTNAFLAGLDGQGGFNSTGVDWPLSALTEATFESPWSQSARQFRAVTGSPVTVFGNCVGGIQYSAMKKGTVSFDRLEKLIEGFGARVPNARVAAVLAYNGEANTQAATPRATFAANLLEWQTDIQAKVRLSTRTGASTTVPLVVRQLASWTHYNTTGFIALGQYDAMKANPGRIVVAGGGYPFVYSGDGVHPTADGSCHMGAMMGRVAGFVSMDPWWRPLMPISVTRVANVITVAFNVPSPPLVVDTTLVTAQTNRGFEYTDATTSASISSVSCGATTCTITLNTTPTGGTRLLRYAYTGTNGDNAGPTAGPRGNIRDSGGNAASVTCNGTPIPLHNWLVTFEEDVP